MNDYNLIIINIITNTIVKLICFYLGYLIIKLGYNLLSEGIKGNFKFTANHSGFKGGLISSSPGLLFVFLGVLLIGYAMSITKSNSLKTYEERKKIEPNTKLKDTPLFKESINDSI